MKRIKSYKEKRKKPWWETNHRINIKVIAKYRKEDSVINIETYKDGCLDSTTSLGPREVEVVKALLRGRGRHKIVKHFHYANFWEDEY